MVLAKQFAKYSSVAAASAASDWICFTALTLLGVNHLAAQGTSRLVGGLVSFFSNTLWAFEAKKGARLGIEARRFLLLYVFSYALSISLLYVCVDILGWNAFVGKAIADTSCFAVNFVVMRVYVFHERRGLTDRLLGRGAGSNESV